MLRHRVFIAAQFQASIFLTVGVFSTASKTTYLWMTPTVWILASVARSCTTFSPRNALVFGVLKEQSNRLLG